MVREAAVQGVHGDRPERVTASAVPDLDLRPRVEQPVAVSSGALFSSTESMRPGATRIASVAAAVVLVVAGAIAVFVVSGYSRTSDVASANSRVADVTRPTTTGSSTKLAAATTPLELVALGHERDGDRLTVHGVVRNPSGAEVDRLTAVVFVFNRDGGFLSSGRAAVASTALAPGGEAKFAVTVPNASDVARYRVSFRTDDRVVPHVDRREGRVASQEKS
jgi:hypothetical protein